MRGWLLVASLSLVLAAPAAAEVFVLGNTQTGHVVIRGNTPDAGLDANREAKGIRDTGWTMLFGDDAPGWGAVSCVKHAGGVQFSLASGHATELEAVKLARAGAEKIQKQTGGSIMFLCAPRWNNRGQAIAFGSDGLPDEAGARKPSVVDQAIGKTRAVILQQTRSSAPRKDYRRDCLPPPEAARAELAPLAQGVMQPKDKRPPAQMWKPAGWCPPSSDKVAIGKRG